MEGNPPDSNSGAPSMAGPTPTSTPSAQRGKSTSHRPHGEMAWERLPGESAKAFAAFMVYRDFGPGRDVNSAYRSTTQQQSNCNKIAPRHWRSWSTTFRWFDRAAAYDAHLDRQRVEAAAQATRDASAEAVARREAVPEYEYRAGRLGMKHAIKQLRLPGGNLKGISQLMRVSSDLMRRGTGLPVAAIEDKPPDMTSVLFESRGQLAAAMPPGAMPEMPADPTVKPELGESVTIGNESPLRKPKSIPQP